MSNGLLSIGLSGLRAAQAGLATTGHNIANVNTPGFSRQQTLQAGSVATFSGIGYVGQGVTVTSVRRVYNEFLSQAVRTGTGSSEAAAAYASQTARIDNWMTDASSNLSSGLDGFFATAQTVANNPSDAAGRQTMLSSARTLAARFNDLGQRLSMQQKDVDQQIDDTVAGVNTLSQEVATLNRRITAGGGGDAGNNQAPNDLLDQRDALITQITGAIGATAVPQSDGSINVFAGNGQALVVGDAANRLVSVADDQDTSKKQLAVVVSGLPQRVSTSQVQSGTLGGLFRFRDEVLTQATNALGQIAIGLGAAMNAQNRLGQDAAGNPGDALFTIASPTVLGATKNSAGSGLAVTITDPKQLTTSDYRLDYDGSNYTLTNLGDMTSRQFASLPQTVDGIRIATSGALAAGDHYTIAPTRSGATAFGMTTTDPSKIAAAAPVALSAASANNGTGRMASLAVTPADPLPASLRAPVDVRFHVSGGTTTYDLVDRASGTAISSGNAYAAGTTIAQNGWTLTFSGTPADNDAFTVGANVNGSGDNRNALLLAGIQNAAVTRSGSAQDAYGGLVGTIGNKTNEASALATAESTILAQATESRDSASGVNLDEEAANLQKYQQAYAAAAKSIAAAGVMFDAVMSLFR